MNAQLILEGVFSTFGNQIPESKLLRKKIKGRKAIPNYYMIDFRVKQNLQENYSNDDYNKAFIEQLKKVSHSCKEFECGNITDSSDILLISIEEDFDGYTLCGLFKTNKQK